MTWIKRNLVFLLTVVVPTVAAILYYGFVASDVFISESRFLVRSPQHQTQGGMFGQLLQGTGLSHSQDDTYSVHDFILSRDALKELEEKAGVRKAFMSKAVDPINRFPGLSWDASFEELYRYYGKHVGVEYDSTSSISTLTVRAFTAVDAHKINDELLQMSEQLINTLNERSRGDLIRFAEAEVKLATDKATAAGVAMFEYRSKHAIFEPDKQAAIQLGSVAKIQEELVSTEAQLAQLRKLSPSNPQIAGMESRADTLRHAISSEAAKVTSVNGSFSARAPEFERLTLESVFSDKQLGVALADLETARSDALRQQLYLERLVQSNLPDKAMEPRRIRSMFTVFLIGMIAWGVASLLIAAIREHSD
ncbi:MAG TPA: capsule biosynthesis protein [Steroidobacteraceae bacterium]|jgi:capsular polysaccharide transport system permease protein